MEKIDREKWRLRYQATSEALERVRAREAFEMTEEEALRQMMSLEICETPWREQEDWSGLVEQQAIFMRGMKR